MKIFIILFAICMSSVLVTGQYFNRFDRIARFSLNAIPNDYYDNSNAIIEDARSNRGPVVFPPPPADSPIESSGVVVGASGFGFVPPSQSNKRL